MHHGETKGAIASRRLDLYLLVRGRYFIFLLSPIGNQLRRSPPGDAPFRGYRLPRGYHLLVVVVVLVTMNKCIMEKKGGIASRRLDFYLLVRGSEKCKLLGGDGFRNFELRSSDEDDTSALKHLPNANDMDVLGIKVLTLMCLGVMRLGFHSDHLPVAPNYEALFGCVGWQEKFSINNWELQYIFSEDFVKRKIIFVNCRF
ncbi:hypothetical protein TNCV_2607321 [Trichonephila clavipes]|uniref:Uncharacterized protein n=1 Tax=Trichonephila clavipes TaxID=2585209 RepID=A0A8X6S6U6_TRICX|nr:hypothetical protein TNCV_2607321 [Trichonephila clavipes]